MDTIDKVRIIESDAAAKEDAAAEKVMATIFHTDGTREKVSPANGSDFRLEEMQRMVGGIIEIVYFEDNTVMVINEEGKLLGLPVNQTATDMAAIYNDVIVGNAILMGTTEEDFIGLTKEAAEHIVEEWGWTDAE